MKRILIAVCLLLLLSTRVSAGTQYLEGTTTGSYYNESLGMWMTRIVQVYVLSDRNVIDDLSYIVVGDGDKAVEAFLLEKGLPGEPNKDTRDERIKFINLLEDAILMMSEAKTGGEDFTKHLARFYSIDVNLKSSDKGRDVKLVLLLHDYGKKTNLALHMNEKEVDELAQLLEQVPPVLEVLRGEAKKRPLLP